MRNVNSQFMIYINKFLLVIMKKKTPNHYVLTLRLQSRKSNDIPTLLFRIAILIKSQLISIKIQLKKLQSFHILSQFYNSIMI